MTATVFCAIKNDPANQNWLSNFNIHWPAYKSWYKSKKANQINPANLLQAEKKLKHVMPEIMPIYQDLVHLTNEDPTASQFLTLYQPPAYLINCSQAVFFEPEPILIRNYDLSPELSENTVFHSNWQGRKVISTNECLWGADDGINDAGLAISLTFGGRKNIGDGFGIPIILRYVLQTCETVKEAVTQLKRIPSHMSYNVTVVDKSGDYATILVSPDKDTIVSKDRVTTNHQQNIEWQEQAVFSRTLERKKHLENLILENPSEKRIVDAFHQPPLHSTNYQQSFGTVYTAVYKPQSSSMSYHWPDQNWIHSFGEFNSGQKSILLDNNPAQHISSEWAMHENCSSDLLSKEIKAQFDNIFDYLPDSVIGNRPAYDRFKQQLNSPQHFDWNQFTKSVQQIWQ